MQTECTFAGFHPEYLTNMAKLRLQEYGGQVAEHQRELEWLMCRNPAGTGEASLAFLPDGSLVGMVLNAALPMAFRNERFNARMTINVLTRPDQRGRGLFVRQLKMAFDESLAGNARVVFGFPNANAMLGWRMLGHRAVGIVNSANQPLFLLSWVSNKVALPPRLRAPWLDDILSGVLPQAAPAERYTRLESLDGVQFEPEIDPNRLTIYTDADWLNWRYLRSPRKYDVIAVGHPAHPDALAIVRTASNKSADGREVLYGLLMDVIRSSDAPGDAKVKAARAGVAWLRERRCHSVKSLFVRGTPYETLLSKVGFWTQGASTAQTNFFTRSDPSLDLPNRIDSYAITYSWADWV
jgi:GNAT acetyltransferase-like protein